MNFGARKLSRDEINACLVCAQSTISTTLAIMREVDSKNNESNMTEAAYKNFRKVYIDLINIENNFSGIRAYNLFVKEEKSNAKVDVVSET